MIRFYWSHRHNHLRLVKSPPGKYSQFEFEIPINNYASIGHEQMTCNRDATLGLRVLSIQEVDSADSQFQLKIILFIWEIYIYVPFPITKKILLALEP